MTMVAKVLRARRRCSDESVAPEKQAFVAALLALGIGCSGWVPEKFPYMVWLRSNLGPSNGLIRCEWKKSLS